MGYSGNDSAGSDVSATISPAMIAFLAMSFYNVLELDVIIFSSFKRRQGLYFWAFLAATNGIAPHSIGFMLKNLLGSHTFILYITLISVGWVPMVTGQSLVLYSRLHLIFRNPLGLRLVLAMIITNAVVLHLPIIILMYGSNSSAVNSWTHVYEVYEKVQVSVFCLQELIISGIYIKTCYSYFDAESGIYGDAVRKMRRHLLFVNVFIILLVRHPRVLGYVPVEAKLAVTPNRTVVTDILDPKTRTFRFWCLNIWTITISRPFTRPLSTA